jgi:ribosomal protein S18 acetylase RimI-like enzyme
MRAAFMQLEAAASAAYNEFVYRDRRQADDVGSLLLERGVAEFADGHTFELVHDDVLQGFISALTAQELRVCRMKSAMVIAKAGFFAEDPDLLRRMQLAAATNVPVEDGDYYISRVAVSPDFSGRGLAGQLLQKAEEQARSHGARRLLLEVAAGNDVALRLYSRHGFSTGEMRTATDPLSGRSLSLTHMIKDLGETP